MNSTIKREADFLAWLSKNGVNSAESRKKYRDRLKALEGVPSPDNEMSSGMYAYLTGRVPSVGVYSVSSLCEFDMHYGLLHDFFYFEDKSSCGYDHQRYEACYDYTHLNTKVTHKGDNRTLLNAYKKYRLFLEEYEMRQYIAAMKTKPFILLAGLSGTGKSRLVRQLARGFCPSEGPLADNVKPGNFEMIQVKPNWHDSTDLMGYVSRVSDTPRFVIKDFVRFLVKAWMFPETPFFLCLDEMNLAPVEQYFAEYLSVIETRQASDRGVVTDPIIKFDEEVVEDAVDRLLAPYSAYEEGEPVRKLAYRFARGMLHEERCIRIPSNLVVFGTVNMDETTFSFSRKVLDRAMSFELNEIDLLAGLDAPANKPLGFLVDEFKSLSSPVEMEKVYADNRELCGKILSFLSKVNDVLDRTPFKIAYRTRNEALVYCIERTRDGTPLGRALDEIMSMKILSRLEGDRARLTKQFANADGEMEPRGLLDALQAAVTSSIAELDPDAGAGLCERKLKEMTDRLDASGYTSFWS